ncbi:MAG TPA: metal-sensitive transcriptional regulator [Acidimicrobiales bacterium]|nr:metal-sensitive transcriptional regulator [Acidimicrobiales bacterium]
MSITRAERDNTGATRTARESLRASTTPHALGDNEQLVAIGKRLRRAHGQLGAVVRMLDEGSSCEEIVTQMAAVSKAVNTAAFNLISASLKECLLDPSIDSGPMTEKFQKLFLSLA